MLVAVSGSWPVMVAVLLTRGEAFKIDMSENHHVEIACTSQISVHSESITTKTHFCSIIICQNASTVVFMGFSATMNAFFFS